MGEFVPYAEYSKKADALYVYLSAGNEVTLTRELDSSRMIDYAPSGAVHGVEFLDVSEGIDLRDIPERETIEKIVEEYHIRILA
jgi:uncharacterized protein YuzE